MHKTSRHDIKRFTCHSCIEQQKQNKCWNCKIFAVSEEMGWRKKCANKRVKYDEISLKFFNKSPISRTHLWVSLARSFSSLEISASLFVTCLTFCKLSHITPNTSSPLSTSSKYPLECCHPLFLHFQIKIALKWKSIPSRRCQGKRQGNSIGCHVNR